MNKIKFAKLVTIFILLSSLLSTPSLATALAPAWETRASMPTARYQASASVVDGKLYVIGGDNLSQGLSTVEVYDPTTDLWSTKTPMPTARGYLATDVVNNVIYAIGGMLVSCCGVPPSQTTVEAYDPVSDTWSSRAPLPAPRHSLGIGVSGGKLYAISGSVHEGGGCATTKNDVWEYDPSTDSWAAKAPIPTPRFGLGVGVINGIIYAVGGEVSPYGNCASTSAALEAYDPSTNEWISKSPLPGPARFYPMVVTQNGKLYVLGGLSPDGIMHTRVDIYDPITDTWSSGIPMSTARGGLTGGVINNVIYVTGGMKDYWVGPLTGILESYSFSYQYPNIFVEPNEDNVFAWGWPAGTLITLTIDDPATTSQTPDYTTTQVASGTEDWEHGFRLGGIFDIRPGHIVTVSGANIIKQHTVTHLTVTDIDTNADTVSGIGNPGSYIHVGTICDSHGCANRNITVAKNGNWLADFSFPESGNPDAGIVFDLRPGLGSSVYENDADNDSTKVNWRVPYPPLFMLNVDNNSSWQGLDAWNWPLGSQVTLTVDDPNATQNPIYTEVQTMREGNGKTHAMYMQDNNLEGKPGFTITLSDGIQTKSMIVPTLTITSYDLDADTITGVSDPFTRITIPVTHCTNEYDCSDWVERTVISNSEGNWDVNFAFSSNPDEATFDLQPGDFAELQFFDEDQDLTVLRDWSVPIDTTPPTMDWIGNIHDGDSFSFGFVPAEPTCIAADSQSGVDGSCTIAGYATTVGTHTLIATAKDKAGNQTTESRLYTVSGWKLKGFYQPVDMNGVYNLVKGGSTVPFKFEVFVGSTELTDVADIKSFTYAQTACNANALTDEIETLATGGTSLRYEGGQFIYNWKTPKTAGKCLRVTMNTIDGSSLVAYFKLK